MPQGRVTRAWAESQDETQDASNKSKSSILSLFDFRSSLDMTIYLPSYAETKKGET